MVGGALGKGGSSSSSSRIDMGQQGSLESALFGGKERIKLSIADFKGRRGVFDSQGRKLGNTRADLVRLREQGVQADYVNEDAQEEFEAAQREGRDFREIDHGMGQLQRGYNDLASLVGKGPGESDVAAGLESQRGLAGMLADLQKSGGLPGQEDIAQANTTAGGLFNARRTALSQSFTDQNTEAERLAARLGRPTNDPILQAKLRQGFMRQSDLLQAEQSDYANNLALSLPNQRLNYASSRADVLGGLASQAFQNRAAILSLGSQLGGVERAWRAQSGTQVTTGQSSQGGGLGGALTGGIAGLGAGLDIASKFGAGSTGNGLSSMNIGPRMNATAANFSPQEYEVSSLSSAIRAPSSVRPMTNYGVDLNNRPAPGSLFDRFHY
jgi:hypothetical protein